MRIASVEGQVVIEFNGACKKDKFVPFAKGLIYNAGVVALKLGLRGYSRNDAATSFKIDLDGMKARSGVWSLFVVDYLLTLSSQFIEIPLPDRYDCLRLRVTSEDENTVRWGSIVQGAFIEFDD